MLPFSYVVHTHPTLVNGLTCSQKGEAAVGELFDAVWIPSINPGYILAQAVKKAIDAYRAQKGRDADLIFLQNHGVFAAANSIEEIKKIYETIMDTLQKRIARKPDLSIRTDPGQDAGIQEQADHFGALLCGLAKESGWKDCRCIFSRNVEIEGLIRDRAAFYPVSSAYSPDHIVYAGSDPLFIEAGSPAEGAWKEHVQKTGRAPKTVAVQGLGVFSLGSSEKTAHDAAELFFDAVKLSVYTESFGGPRFMERDKIDFINNWEVEKYRSKVAEN
jgi:rhamnose utilization protein RhaD (predicted bifunctional aldolase and dehydrogenase)